MDSDHLVLSLDEVAVRKGHQYETVLLDAQLGCVLGMIHQRTTESTKQLLHQHVLSKEAVQTVEMDMWEPFHKAVKFIFPLATIVVDKYHVIQKVTQALDHVRKKHSKLKQTRYLFLKGYEKLTDQQKMKLDELLVEHSDLAYAYYLKEKLRDFYQIQDYDDALNALEEWNQLAWSSPFPSFHEVAKTLERWKAEILQYFFCPYTNGRTEGTNHKIKNMKRRAYGYRNLNRFRLRVFFECTGKTLINIMLHKKVSSASSSVAGRIEVVKEST
jgi:transposase